MILKGGEQLQIVDVNNRIVDRIPASDGMVIAQSSLVSAKVLSTSEKIAEAYKRNDKVENNDSARVPAEPAAKSNRDTN